MLRGWRTEDKDGYSSLNPHPAFPFPVTQDGAWHMDLTARARSLFARDPLFKPARRYGLSG